jgi:hypothetical protein
MVCPTQWVPEAHSVSLTHNALVPDPQVAAQWVRLKMVCPLALVVSEPQQSMPLPQSAV